MAFFVLVVCTGHVRSSVTLSHRSRRERGGQPYTHTERARAHVVFKSTALIPSKMKFLFADFFYARRAISFSALCAALGLSVARALGIVRPENSFQYFASGDERARCWRCVVWDAGCSPVYTELCVCVCVLYPSPQCCTYIQRICYFFLPSVSADGFLVGACHMNDMHNVNATNFSGSLWLARKLFRALATLRLDNFSLFHRSLRILLIAAQSICILCACMCVGVCLISFLAGRRMMQADNCMRHLHLMRLKSFDGACVCVCVRVARKCAPSKLQL